MLILPINTGNLEIGDSVAKKNNLTDPRKKIEICQTPDKSQKLKELCVNDYFFRTVIR